MSLLDQISIVQFGNVKTFGAKLSHRLKDSTYVRWKDEFETPRHALGNRHRNPIMRLSDKLVHFLLTPFRVICRIEVSVRIRRD